MGTYINQEWIAWTKLISLMSDYAEENGGTSILCFINNKYAPFNMRIVNEDKNRTNLECISFPEWIELYNQSGDIEMRIKEQKQIEETMLRDKT